MVDARSDLKKQSDVSGRPNTDGTADSGRAKYTPRDAEQFTKLVALTQIRSNPYAAGDDQPETSPSSAFDYTEGDQRAFEKLMTSLDRHNGTRRSSGRRNPKGAGSSGYSESDNRLFNEMMAFDRHRPATSLENAAREQGPAVGAVRYSQQDLRAFAKLMPDEPTDGEHRADEEKLSRTGRDRDVGHIRIVDFDKEHAGEREGRRRGNPNIKIRYFD